MYYFKKDDDFPLDQIFLSSMYYKKPDKCHEELKELYILLCKFMCKKENLKKIHFYLEDIFDAREDVFNIEELKFFVSIQFCKCDDFECGENFSNFVQATVLCNLNDLNNDNNNNNNPKEKIFKQNFKYILERIDNKKFWKTLPNYVGNFKNYMDELISQLKNKRKKYYFKSTKN